ncbi:MAG: CBS domain-containing protein [Chloroflexota bacterium]|jgi:CBS-domain-containing membrane protein|uniref:CBS domain-containing protein n=1 Tax=Candidatus Nitricoxidivorans perseverans TaxID=2975601 RepID=A0AA49FLC8_9PROT|nr:MAG: CBS domain-containing protein [Candidatus Nitricoxidivorans perseverans]
MSLVCECDVGEIVLSDVDVVEAMAHIPGFLDISTEDFQVLYHLAHHNAIDRLTGRIRAANLMRTDLTAITTGMTMEEAACKIVASRYKGLPVVDASGRVVGMLTETDFLRRLKSETFLELMLHLISDQGELSHRCHETCVLEAMSSPTITIGPQADFREILDAFKRHDGRSMPVVDEKGLMLGLLLRKDFLSALAWDIPPLS